MPRVIIESPFAGDTVRNIAYARACVSHSLRRGESPLAFHLLYTQEGILDDMISEERELGIRASFRWYPYADICAVYRDYGLSDGMKQGIEHAIDCGILVETRRII